MVKFYVTIREKKSDASQKVACLVGELGNTKRFISWNSEDISFITGLIPQEIQELEVGDYELTFFEKIAKARTPLADLLARIDAKGDK